MTVAVRDDTFVDAVSGYPVDLKPLKDLVGSITLAEIAEAKTSDAARYGDPGLASATAETGGGTEVTHFDDSGVQFAHVIAGARDYMLGGATGRSIAPSWRRRRNLARPCAPGSAQWQVGVVRDTVAGCRSG